LLHAGHSKLHIPSEIEEAKGLFPEIRFTYGQTIGIHSEVFEILKTRLKDINFDIYAKHPETVILLIARGSSDADAIADVYKISNILNNQLDVLAVETAFMGVAEPTVA